MRHTNENLYLPLVQHENANRHLHLVISYFFRRIFILRMKIMISLYFLLKKIKKALGFV